MQLGAIFAEEIVQRAWVEVVKHLRLERQYKLLWIVKRMVGYCMCVDMALWSRSKIYYPKAFRMGDQ